MAKYDVLVEIYQGVLGDVEILSHEAAAEKWAKWAKKHHYADYEDFLKALNEDGVDEELRWFPEVETQEVGGLDKETFELYRKLREAGNSHKAIFQILGFYGA